MKNLFVGILLCASIGQAQQTCPYTGYTCPNDYYFAYTGNQYGLYSIFAPLAWSISTGSSSVVIAVISTGAATNNPDLQGKLAPGWNVITNSSNTTETSTTGTGTSMAGIIGALTNNNIGIAGMCWTCMVMPIVVVASDGSSTDAQLAAGITYAQNHGAQVAVIGYGIDNESYPLSVAAAHAYETAGGVIVFPTGDYGGVDTDAADPQIIYVGAVNLNNLIYSWSVTGNVVTLVAPGFSEATFTGSQYIGISGTVVSASYVAGLAGLMLSVNPSLTPSQVISTLETTATHLGTTGRNSTYGYGVINAHAALVAVGGGGAKTSTATTLISNTNPSNLNQSVTFSVVVSPAAATGTITFLNGSSSIGTASLSNGIASLTVSNLSGGGNVITASYGGSSTYAASTSTPLTQNVIVLDNESWNFVSKLNNYRVQQGLSPVQVDLYLENDAQWMSAAMAANNFYSTTDNQGRTTAQRATAFAYTGSVSESIANTTTTGLATITALNAACDANSNGVCTYNDKNLLLNSNTKAVGVARAASSTAACPTECWDIEYGNTLLVAVPATEVPAPTISSFTASPATISIGQASTLSFTEFEGSTVSINNGVGNVGIAATASVMPSANTTYTLTSTNASGTATTNVTVTLATVSTIAATSGGSQSANTFVAFTNPFVATVKDTNSNPVSGVLVTFTAPAQTGASGTFASGVNTSITNSSGVATSAAFTANGSTGTYNVVASVATTGSSTATVNFSETNNQAPAATVTATSGTPQTTNISMAFGLPLVATVKDAGGHPVPSVTVTFTAPTSSASGLFANSQTTTTATTNSAGVATSSTFTANSTAGGPYNVVASTPSATSANFALTNASVSVPGTPTLVSVTPSGSNVTAVVSAGGGGTPTQYVLTKTPSFTATFTGTTYTGSMTAESTWSAQACNPAGCSAASNAITTVP